METMTPEPLVAVDDDEELIYINNSSSEVIMTTGQIENKWNVLPEDAIITRPLRNQSSLENYDMSLNPSNVHDFVGRDLLLFPRMASDGTVISSLTMGNFDRVNIFDRKLSVAESRIYGREHELALLENAYQRICDPGHDSEVVFVKGFTGTGKSALVESLRNPVQVRDEEPYYVYGKFDLQAKNEPFSALVNAFTDICEAILQSDELDEMKDAITEALGNDSKGMTSLISNLAIIINDGNEKGSAFSDQDVVPYSAPSSTRFRLICRAFLRAVATEKHPIIFVLDDIHCADTASVDIIKALLTDTRSKHVLIILVCRSGEVKEDSPMETLLHLESNCKLTGEKCLVSTGIDLGNLQIDTVNMIISNLTGSDLEVTLSLSKVVFRKTLGNVFFVFQFLDMLASRRLLVFSLKNQNWEWDIEKIESETTVADNVGELIVSKIQRLNQNVLEALKVASCLGRSFNCTVLRKILASELAFQEGVEPNEASSSEDSGWIIFKGSVDRMLEIAISEGMIENSVHRYKFTHDKVSVSFVIFRHMYLQDSNTYFEDSVLFL
jgi:predicted ATPase